MACYNSIVITSALTEVWPRLRDFHNLSWAPNVIESVQKISDKAGDQVGAQRILNGALHETLLALDDTQHTFRYRLDDGPAPIDKNSVSHYIAEVRAFSVSTDNSTFVTWTASWAGGDHRVAAFCNPLYQAILNDLKNTFSQ